MTDPDDVFEGALPAHAAGRYIYPGLPSTVLEVRQALIDYEATRPRSLQVALGPSEIGAPCAQQVARKLRDNTKPPAQEPAWAPWQGTQVHRGMDDLIDFMNEVYILDRPAFAGRRYERNTRVMVDPDLWLSGELDAYDNDHDMVIDWKHVGETALKALRTARAKGLPLDQQVDQTYRVQAHLYGYGQQLAGRPVKFVRLVFLARSWKFDDSEEWTEPYDPLVARWAINRYERIAEHVADGKPVMDITAAPSSKCWWCPFRRPGQASDESGCAGR